MKNWRGKLTPQFIPRDSIIKKTLPWLAPKHVFYIYVQLGYMHPQLIGERPIRNFLDTEIATNTPLPLLALSLVLRFPLRIGTFFSDCKIDWNLKSAKNAFQSWSKKNKNQRGCSAVPLWTHIITTNWNSLIRKLRDTPPQEKWKTFLEEIQNPRWFLLPVN